MASGSTHIQSLTYAQLKYTQMNTGVLRKYVSIGTYLQGFHWKEKTKPPIDQRSNDNTKHGVHKL